MRKIEAESVAQLVKSWRRLGCFALALASPTNVYSRLTKVDLAGPKAGRLMVL
jgi:hypothetical protein